MGRHSKKVPLFTIGDFVFAKVRGYRAWPGRILDRVGSNAYDVYFYGSRNHAKVPSTKIFDFERNQRIMGTLRSKSYACRQSFQGAMRQARQAFSNPEQDFGFYQQLALNEDNCVNAEDLNMNYLVADEQEEEPDLQGQKLKEPLEIEDTEEEKSKETSDQLYTMSPITALNSKKMKPKNLFNRKPYSMPLLDDVDSDEPMHQDAEEKRFLQVEDPPLMEQAFLELEKFVKEQAVRKTQENQLKKPEAEKPYSMLQLDGLAPEEFKELNKGVDELRQMLKDIEDKEEPQDSNKLHYDMQFLLDQPLNLSNRRRAF
ncbi:hepatoma-derived growth factor [Drosophila ficusphila]|uniref:hepatoma-derived growth factor n=1 Tax=Drosophila ficusphila TaxID=30025 RepID=UPI0007E6EBAD|nr:hepatoma-derived growth factor [Drosophila ficusphila]